MISATASPFLTTEAEGVFSMADNEQKSVQILVESAETVAKAVYKSDKGEDYKLFTTDISRINARKIKLNYLSLLLY